MNNIMYQFCPVCNNICGDNIGELRYTLTDNHPLRNFYNIVCCSRCGFVKYDTPLNQEDYNKFYEDYFYSPSYISRKIDENEENYIINIIENISSYTNKQNKIFDIGCGNGLLLKKLKELGSNSLYGIDLSESCVELLKKGGINAEQGSVLNIPFDEKADVIILSHVLEHVLDLKSALKCLYDKLSDDGIVYVEVPDAYRYDEFEDVSPLRYFYLQHIVHFDKFHLTHLFENNGFLKIDSGYSTRVEGDLKMPCVWCIFKKINMGKINISDFTLAFEIKSWFDEHNKVNSLDNNDILKNLVDSKKNVYIWGLGIHMNMMLSMSPLKDCNIKYYIDNNERTQKETINSQKIYSTDKLKEATKDDVIVIGAPTHFKEMYNYLKEIKFKGQIIKCGFGNVEEIS
jgi:SAM-dependent methyltransferase